MDCYKPQEILTQPDIIAIHKVENTYTPLGQLKQKKITEGTTILQTIDYTYNIRGVSLRCKRQPDKRC